LVPLRIAADYAAQFHKLAVDLRRRAYIGGLRRALDVRQRSTRNADLPPVPGEPSNRGSACVFREDRWNLMEPNGYGFEVKVSRRAGAFFNGGEATFPSASIETRIPLRSLADGEINDARNEEESNRAPHDPTISTSDHLALIDIDRTWLGSDRDRPFDK